MKLIDEQPDMLNSHKFVLVTNKAISENAFVKALEKFGANQSIDELKISSYFHSRIRKRQ